MKRFNLFITAIVAVMLASCGSNDKSGKIYMPDMAYSRAVETYALLDSTKFTDNTANAGRKIYYNRMPVEGTIKRGDEMPYIVPLSDSAGGLYTLSNQLKNPVTALSTKDSLEAARLFNINCGVCHGAKAGSDGPVAAKIGGVKSIITASPNYSDGRIFHVINYGQGNMGSYASQLSAKQRWMIIHYIRSLEPKKEAVVAAALVVAKADEKVKK